MHDRARESERERRDEIRRDFRVGIITLKSR